MERCPNCRARTERAATCRRCGMELTLLQATEQAAAALYQSACRALSSGDPAAAAAALERANALLADPLSAHLTRFVRTLASPPRPAPRPRPWSGPPTPSDG